MIYVNLWYDMYFEKTNAQLKSFRKLGYTTHVMTVEVSVNTLTCKIILLSDSNTQNTICTFSCKKNHGFGYFPVFKKFFDYVIKEKYDFIYIRRLMLKLAFANPYIRNLSRHVPIVYEIPTYPFDKTYSIKLSIRDKVEWCIFKHLEKYLKIVPAVLCKDISLHDNWLPFLNMIDIDNYEISDIPDLSDTIRLIAVSNMHKSHCYERLLYALKSYGGKHKIHLTMISRETDVYLSIKTLAKELHLENIITFYPEKEVSDVKKIAKSCHIGIGRLTYGEKDRTIDTSLKNKDYCAMGLPFVSSLTDLSFPLPFPYHYIISNDTYDIDLDKIIDWYIDIRKDKEYKVKMYNYAKEHLQYDITAKEIVSRLGL